MFGVVQFLENGRMQVLAVPMSWMKGHLLMWPKSIGNEKIEQMRKNGTVFHGSTKAIPALLVKKCRKLESAEAAVVELAQKEVSDLDGKKKILKSMKKKKSDSGAKDLNDLCTGRYYYRYVFILLQVEDLFYSYCPEADTARCHNATGRSIST